MIWPLAIASGVMLIAYLLYRMLPEIIDYENSILWITGIFLLVYIAAAYYLSRSLPSLRSTPSPTQAVTVESLTVVQVSDVISQ